jgi:hypothetical protein
MWIGGRTGTELLILREKLAQDPNGFTQIEWEVWSHDGVDSVRCTSRYRLSVAPISEHERAQMLIPKTVTLGPLYPNPFNDAITIEFGVPELLRTQVTIHDVNGRLVRALMDRKMNAGNYQVQWDGMDARGAHAAAGIYVCRVMTPLAVKMQTIVLLK